ncbi:uncharacterized protein LOC111326145 [Stylophora pistillata]|uniref:ZMYM2-like/QRICH1 C-terminal domain-containing protein n=1 Tax=Stylophora pistillata TaxID=50429 RepID=A0A2B4SIW4_STYPI|nr:uncharacterized protein LOC111326145 [Stylophora pistillata]PFX28508.1 hypothetical protein AWC38_SpisGene6774 [Stylophora pistillata]
MDNHGEADNECHRENDEVISRTPANISNIIDQSVSVTVERLNYETNIEIKKERNNEFQLDENESFGDGEAQEDDSQRENHGRKHISTLTSRHYASHVRVFKEWLKCKGMEDEFEDWKPREISNWLSDFYKESHLKHGGTKRASSLRIIRSAIDHHLKSEPYCKSYSLTHSPEFSKANATLHDLEAAQKEYLDSSECSSTASALNVEEIRKLWATGVVGIKTPKSLQRLVFLAVGINFGITSRDDLRDLTPDMFEFHIDETTGLEYAACKLSESLSNQLRSKKYKGIGRKMFSVPGSLQCPVAALKLFLQRRNPSCPAFFQIPNRDFATSGVWYRSQAAGLNCLSGMLKDMSHEALLPVDYSNHNLRATPPIVLYKAMEDLLRPPRIVNGAILNNKIALNSSGPPPLLNSHIPATAAVNIDASPRVGPGVQSNHIQVAPREASTVGNVSNPLDNVPYSNPAQNLHQVFCIPQQWNISDIIKVVNSGEALVIVKEPSKTEGQSHVNGEVTQIRDTQQPHGRSGRKQPEPKRFCRDPDVLKDESSKVEDACMKAVNTMKTALQNLDDLMCKQHPSGKVIEELSGVSYSIQELLQRINSAENC